MRGEDAQIVPSKPYNTETPPHAWGRLYIEHGDALDVRNTPTCVGKMVAWKRNLKAFKKHPHMRGEDVLPIVDLLFVPETPPHAWGRFRCVYIQPVGRRNTPTCVGKIRLVFVCRHQCEKHPHMRGEDSEPSAPLPLPKETPPHAWGRSGYSYTDFFFIGNTPTCVGKIPVSC